MTVLVVAKNTFTQTQLNNVSNIAFASNTYTITAGGTNYTYSADDYKITVLW